MKIGYLDLASGVSGDMLLGCLIDCGWGVDRLRGVIEAMDLPVGRWAVEVQEVRKGALRARRVDVLAEEEAERRGLSKIRDLIARSRLPEPVRGRATAVFERLARAEAKVHGIPVEEVHFHEVGAIDAIVDIVGVVAGFDELGIQQVYASALPLGEGWAQSAHGKIPLPAPATLELLAEAGAPTRPAPGPAELVTPTGAALVVELARFEQPAMRVRHVGVGAGSRDFAWPNVARLWVGEPDGAGAMVQIETNIDDMNPQLYSAVVERLLSAGARDVWLTPVQMKKGRPGVVLNVLGTSADEAKLVEIVLRETTTLGVRVHPVHHRHEAQREMRRVATEFGQVAVKVKWVNGQIAGAMPEFEDCRRLAEAKGVSVKSVLEAASAAATEILQSED